MTTAWWTVAIVGAATIAIKGAGPVLLGGRPLPERLGRVIGLLAPALLAALVAINTLGVGAAAVAIWFRAPPLLVVVVAATVTAVVRAL